ncbi:MAG: SigE family RNA polymerase sigma factor [Pseudonocardiales bacterium]|nr:MAG: SigE family RNA polymerase sigma factor [Pseudonocardiales bacterium]
MDVARVNVSALYAAHRVRLVRMAVLLVDDLGSAEDVVQDAFIGLHRNQEKVRDPEAALGYLRTAVVNGARSMLRRRQTVRKHLRRVQPMAEAAPDSELLLAEEHREVLAAVRTLPPGQQEVLVLRYWSDLSEADIAQALGISRGAVKSQASRGMDKLEKILEGTR